jgi:hypothetical protein
MFEGFMAIVAAGVFCEIINMADEVLPHDMF